ncbi:hypothetical protein [Candidatus Nephthysia bennettiae]|uniref:Uncharacterized protein n=1 Tax=Candidatus Nephthysia bennettiae TaxID=3127016 RepID=A0A934N124_9BACT|nr:hypothetical protein [Candidatus Dormibacteraeota bacterium]
MPLTLTISASPVQEQAGPKGLGPLTIVGAANIEQVDVRALASGDNVFTVPTAPAGVVGCLIVPPTTNTFTLKLKGSAGDTGIVISKTGPTVLGFDPAALPAAIIVNSSASFVTGQLVVNWF